MAAQGASFHRTWMPRETHNYKADAEGFNSLGMPSNACAWLGNQMGLQKAVVLPEWHGRARAAGAGRRR